MSARRLQEASRGASEEQRGQAFAAWLPEFMSSIGLCSDVVKSERRSRSMQENDTKLELGIGVIPFF